MTYTGRIKEAFIEAFLVWEMNEFGEHLFLFDDEKPDFPHDPEGECQNLCIWIPLTNGFCADACAACGRVWDNAEAFRQRQIDAGQLELFILARGPNYLKGLKK